MVFIIVGGRMVTYRCFEFLCQFGLALVQSCLICNHTTSLFFFTFNNPHVIMVFERPFETQGYHCPSLTFNIFVNLKLLSFNFHILWFMIPETYPVLYLQFLFKASKQCLNRQCLTF